MRSHQKWSQNLRWDLLTIIGEISQVIVTKSHLHEKLWLFNVRSHEISNWEWYTFSIEIQVLGSHWNFNEFTSGLIANTPWYTEWWFMEYVILSATLSSSRSFIKNVSRLFYLINDRYKLELVRLEIIKCERKFNWNF